MSAFNDATCKCGSRLGWIGELRDRPRCPECGAELSDEDRDECDRLEQELEAKLLAVLRGRVDLEHLVSEGLPQDIAVLVHPHEDSACNPVRVGSVVRYSGKSYVISSFGPELAVFLAGRAQPVQETEIDVEVY